jgi:hypothetical protein
MSLTVTAWLAISLTLVIGTMATYSATAIAKSLLDLVQLS